MRRRRFETWIWWVFGIIAAAMLGVAIILVVNAINPSADVEDDGNDIAQMSINLNGVSLEEIKKGGKSVIYYGNEVELKYGEDEEIMSEVEIGGRGNSTWDQVKKPFKLKLNKRQNLLGLGKSKKWVLLANYFDDTHLRNEIAFELWNMMNETMQMHEEPVELYVDEEWEGLYYITRKIEIAKSMVDVRDSNGVIVELDNINNEDEQCYYTESNNCLAVRDLVVEENEEIAMQVFLQKFNAFEKAAEEKNWEKLQEVCDIDSMAIYFLMAEFSADPDAYASSYFFYLDGENDKIHAGPIWDYDFAFANERWAWGSRINNSPDNNLPMRKNAFGFNYYDRNEGSYKEVGPNMRISRMFYWMIEMPEFREAVRNEIEEDLMGKRGDLIKKIIARAKQIRSVAKWNNEKWERNDYDEEVKKLIQWVFKRYDYIEKEYGKNN